MQEKLKNKEITIGIIGGRGLLGMIFVNFFRKQNFRVLTSGRKTKLTNIELTKKSDVVIFSVPISSTIKVVREVLPYTRKEQLLMDFTSIKEIPVKEMLKSKAGVIGLHPMFGKIESLRGKTIVAIPARPRKWLDWLLPLFKKERINVIITDSKKHDEIMAILQGLIHFSFITTGYALSEISRKKGIKLKDLMDYGGIIYRIRLGMIARILSQDPGLYAGLAMFNKNTKESIVEYEKITKKLGKIIKEKNKKGFEKFFNQTSSFFGKFKNEALEESNFLIERLSRSRLRKLKVKKNKKWQK